jgi:hypothetical protein
MEVLLQRPLVKDALVIVVTLGVFALVAYVYLKLRPTVILPPPSMVATCPGRWSYDPDTRNCVPQYTTQCKAFDPEAYTPVQKCDIANACGTYWKGLCTL